YSILPKVPRFWLLLAVSLAFYGSFNWKFLFLLVGVIATTYLGGLALHTWRSARWQLVAWVLAAMAPLLFYKYLIVWFDRLRLSVLPISDLKFGGYGEVLIPVGLSFFTFQSLAYLIDVARGYYEAERNPAKVGLFIAFFPQLLAGPIERWPHLAPQLFEGKRPTPDMVLDGLVLLAYGLFMKLVLGDSLGVYVDAVYAEPAKNASATAWLGIVGFTLQLYADFCGYSLIAIGSALLFGIRVINNFKQPFFARSIVEFWQRWHISLTRWIGDYVYRPLALRSIKLAWLPRHGQESITLLITWVIMGLWHGANWTFVVFGLAQAVLLFGYTVWSRKRRGNPARARAVAGWALTFA
ncbi:MAG: MBOAT family O-acyltransferase, partial [Pseudomonadota bacterium]